MKLVGFTREDASIDSAHRIDATFETKSGELVSIFFEVSGAHEISDASVRDCLYLIGSTIAFWFGDGIIEVPGADKILHANVREAHRKWNQWSGNNGSIQHVGDFETTNSHSASDRSAAVFFSGGIDSYFSLLNLPEKELALLSIEHTEADPASISDGFARLADLQNSASENAHRRNVKIVTNMMVAHPRILDQWALRLHGPFYAACALLVSDTISSAAISSTFEYSNLKPWGSHPELDPLWSSSSTQIVHFGADHSRAEKTELVARSATARSTLSVCEKGRYADGSQLNCSKCTKCYRTMLTLDALGYAPSEASAFDWSDYSMDKIRRKFIHGPGEARLLNEVVALADKHGRQEISNAIGRAINRSRPLMWITSVERFLRRKFPNVVNHRQALRKFRNRIISLFGYTPG